MEGRLHPTFFRRVQPITDPDVLFDAQDLHRIEIILPIGHAREPNFPGLEPQHFTGLGVLVHRTFAEDAVDGRSGRPVATRVEPVTRAEQQPI